MAYPEVRSGHHEGGRCLEVLRLRYAARGVDRADDHQDAQDVASLPLTEAAAEVAEERREVAGYGAVGHSDAETAVAVQVVCHSFAYVDGAARLAAGSTVLYLGAGCCSVAL